MNTKDWSRKELNTLLMEAWGYKAPTNEGIEHLCAMKVTEKATGRVGHPINHTLLENGTVTHYDVEFDDVIVEGMPAEALDTIVTKEYMHSAKRDDDDHDDKKPRKKYVEEEGELDEELNMVDHDGNSGTPEVPDFAADGKGKKDLKKKKVSEAQLRKAIREALKQHLSSRK